MIMMIVVNVVDYSGDDVRDDDDDDNDYVGRLRTDGELGELLSIAIACCQKKL